MPTKWWNGWSKDSYTLILDNGISSTTTTIMLETGNNSTPLAVEDSATFLSGETACYIDVLANDSDAHSDNISVVFSDRKSFYGGSMKFDKKLNKVKYIRPANKVANFEDTFSYYLLDKNGKRSDSVTVTISVKLNN